MRDSKGRFIKKDKVCYATYHHRVEVAKGKPRKCEVCGTESAKKYDWANLTHSNYDDVNNYKRMCVSCHRKHDFNTGLIPHYGGFKKGNTFANGRLRGYGARFI